MSLEAIRQQIESFFATGWASATDIKYENVDLDTSTLTEYVAIAIREGQSVQFSLGASGTYTSPGIVIISIFTRRSIGTKTARTLADQAAAIFRGDQTTAVRFRVPSGSVVQNNTDWFQYNITVPFYAYFNI